MRRLARKLIGRLISLVGPEPGPSKLIYGKDEAGAFVATLDGFGGWYLTRFTLAEAREWTTRLLIVAAQAEREKLRARR